MRLRLLLALVVVFMAFAASNSFAADTCYTATDTCWVCRTVTGDTIKVLDVHACDTVRLGCPVFKDLTIGDSIAVPVYLFNSDSLVGMSLGFKKNSLAAAVNFRRFVKNSAKIPAEWTWLKASIAADSQSLLTGGADFTAENGMPPSSGAEAELLGTIYLRIGTGATRGWINLDSSFYPPAGQWLLSPTISNVAGAVPSFGPKYTHCASPGTAADIYLPVLEYDSPNLPETYTLGQNSPNPFNPNTSIEFALPRSGKVKVEVFNILGQRVRTLVDENLKAGFKRVEWDGADEGGQSVASGVYLYRMTVNDFSETKKMVLMK